MRRLSAAATARGGKTPRRGARTAASGRRKSGRAALRRRPMPRWQAMLLRLGGGLAALCLVVAGLGLLWQSGWIGRSWHSAVAQVVAASGDAGFALREVLVEGRDETAADDLMAAIGVRRGQPMLAFSPAEIKARVEALPWVRSAVVERRLPDTLYLRIREFEPMALWQRAHELVLVSRSGEVIPDPRIGRFAHLLVIVGDEAPVHAPALLAMLALEPRLAPHVTGAVWVSGRRWNLRLDNGTDVKLPEENGIGAWQELARLDREHGLLDHDLMEIDLRIPDRLVVRLSPDAMARYRAPANST